MIKLTPSHKSSRARASKLVMLAERRQKLILQAAEQRIALAQCITPLRRPLAIAGYSLQVVRYSKKHPVLMLGATALFGLIRRDRFNKLLQTGWSAFQFVRNARNWLLKNCTKIAH